MIAEGTLKLRIAKKYPLAEAPQAHQDMESRRLTGKFVLMP
jgi:NADPH2:quinone reductase